MSNPDDIINASKDSTTAGTDGIPCLLLSDCDYPPVITYNLSDFF